MKIMNIAILRLFSKGDIPGTDLIPKPQSGTTSLTSIINFFLYAVGIAAVVMIIYGGYLYISSGGDAGKLAKAKNTILWAVIGLAVVVLSYAIVNFVIKTL